MVDRYPHVGPCPNPVAPYNGVIGSMDADAPKSETDLQETASVADGPRRSETVDDGQRPSMADGDGQDQPTSDSGRHRQQRVGELHTITIREAVTSFDAAGVPRSERTLVRWCGRDARGMGRLDCVYDQNERRYLITPESIERAIEEEKTRAKSGREERVRTTAEAEEPATRNTPDLERELIETKATISWKDKLITQLGKDRERLFGEIGGMVDKLSEAHREIGRLETEVRLLQAPSERLGEAKDGANVSQ